LLYGKVRYRRKPSGSLNKGGHTEKKKKKKNRYNEVNIKGE
jgi:hypothetical protein